MIFVGYEIIYEFGKLLNEIKRDGDIVGRLSEIKFCILLHTSDQNLGRLSAKSNLAEIKYGQNV